MKKLIIIILALILTLNSTIITSANTTYLAGKTFINNVKNISFNNNWECDVDEMPSSTFKNVSHDITVITKDNPSEEAIHVLLHKNNTSLNEGKNILINLLSNKELQLKDFKTYKDYSTGENEYVYSVTNIAGKTLEMNSKYGSLVMFLKCFPNEKKTFIGLKAIESNKTISSIDPYITQLRNKINILNTTQIVKRIRPLSKKSIAHLKKIQKYIKKNKSRKIVKTASSSLKNYEESYMTKFKKKSRFKDVLFLTWGAYSKKESAKNFYKVVSRSANKSSKLKSFKRKIIKLKKKQYKARIYTICNKKRKICGIIIAGINTKTNVVMTATIKKENINKRNIKNFKRKYIKFTKKILKG